MIFYLGLGLQGLLALAVTFIAYGYSHILFRPVLVMFVVLIAVVPIYWVPPPGGVPFTLAPAAFAALILAPLAIVRIGWRDTHVVDYLVLGLLVTGIVTNFLNFDYATNFTFGLVIRLGLYYVAFRIIAQDYALLRLITVTTFSVGTLLAIEAVYERTSGNNVFLVVRTPGYQADIWGKIQTRFGSVRAAASFGHPIALGMFIATCVILGLALYGMTTHQRLRVAIICSELLLLGGLWATLTRGPFLMAVGGFLLFALRTPGQRRVTQLAGGALVILLAWAFTPLGSQLTQFYKASTGQSNDAIVESSTAFRGSLFSAMFDPDNWSMFGLAKGGPSGVQAVVGTSLSIDNEYLLRLLQYGGISLVLFVALVAAAIYAAFTETDPLRMAWAISTVAGALCLFTVALLLQEGDFFWIGVAVTAAGIANRQRNGRHVSQLGMVRTQAEVATSV